MVEIPSWLKEMVGANKAALRQPGAAGTGAELDGALLNTVCVQALCPNRGKCFSEKEATFLILGDACTRKCAFCAVKKGKPQPPDPDECRRIGETSAKLKLKYVVITSPTRDDLPDGGANHFAETILMVRKLNPGAGVEVLIPDFGGNLEALKTVMRAGPDVIAHNLETVPELYNEVRQGADYMRSLKLLKAVKDERGGNKSKKIISTKSGLMLGLGETPAQIEAVLTDLLIAECDILTLGQYLSPSKKHLPVKRYLDREEFAEWQTHAQAIGFQAVMSAPLVRSSYKAGELYQEVLKAEVLKKK